MKRVLAFASALALAVGAIAPAAFASDNVPAHISLTDIYADPELYDLYVAPYYNNLSFQDWGDYATDAVISGFPMDTVKQVEATEGGLESLWNTVHNAFTFGYNIGQDWVSKFYVDTSDGRLKSDGNIMTDDLKALLDQYFKTSPSLNGGTVSVGSGVWVSQTYLTNRSGYKSDVIDVGGSNVAFKCFITRLSNGTYVGASWQPYSSGRTAQVWGRPVQYDSGNGILMFALNNTYTYNGVRYCVNSNLSSFFDFMPNNTYGLSAQPYSTSDAAFADFFGHQPVVEPVWNGDGYYRDEYNVDIALPAIPAIDWKDLNYKYYTEYGGDFVEGDVNNFYYDISYNYFPAEYTYTIPYWLIDGNTSVLDFDYSLELPTVDLYELPSEFSGGEEVWDSSFTMLGGFGAFILLGFSFGLVALFFKD